MLQIGPLAWGENKMWNAYVAASALLYAILAVMHLVRIINRWSVVIGPNNVSMNVSWLPCRFCPALNLGLRTISLSSGYRTR